MPSIQISQKLYFYYFASVLGNNIFLFLTHLQLKKMTTDVQLILDAMASSTLVEVQVTMFTLIFTVDITIYFRYLIYAILFCVLPG
jgi:hypothetical protein